MPENLFKNGKIWRQRTISNILKGRKMQKIAEQNLKRSKKN